MLDEFDYDLSPGQWETLKAVRTSASRLPAMSRYAIESLMALGLVIGLILERSVMRLVYGRDEVVMVLVTYAAFLILEDVVILVWGAGSYPTYQPLLAAGNTAVGALILSNYDLGLIATAALIAALLAGQVLCGFAAAT